MIFQEKGISSYILLTDQIPLSVTFTSWDIGQYVHYNSLFPIFWRREFWKLNSSDQLSRFSAWPKSSDKNVYIMREKRAFRWNKNHFSSIWRSFSCQKWSQTWEFTFKLGIFLLTSVVKNEKTLSWAYVFFYLYLYAILVSSGVMNFANSNEFHECYFCCNVWDIYLRDSCSCFRVLIFQ